MTAVGTAAWSDRGMLLRSLLTFFSLLMSSSLPRSLPTSFAAPLQLKGYKKEVVESADGGIEKIYFHKWCSQLKDWKAIHATQWKNVMDSMMGNFRAAERAVADERTRRETEAAAALELQTQQMMEDVDLLESASRGDVAAKSANKRSVGSRIGKTFKAFTAAMGCKGNNNKAVDEEATKKQS